MESSFVATLKKYGKNIADQLMQPTVVTTGGISVLINSDQMGTVLTVEVSRFEENESLIEINSSKFGWTFQGTTTALGTTSKTSRMMVYVLRTHAVESDEMVRSLWELESMGLSESIDEGFQQTTTVQRFEKTIRFLNGRYEVAQPSKEGFEHSNNKQVATTRLQRLLCRLSKNEALLKMYDKTIREYLESGHAEVLETSPSNPEKLKYMPHREVIREQALTMKVRIVFDASSHARGCKSLNECLEKGDNWYQETGKILLRLWTHPITVKGDIEKRFLQITIKGMHFDFSGLKNEVAYSALRMSSRNGE